MGMRRAKAAPTPGFTLIELMITLAVLVIVATVAAPAMGDYMLKSRVRGAADDLANQIALARAEALRLDRDVSVNVVATSQTQWCAGGRQFVVTGTEGIVLASGVAPTCDCSTSDVSNCSVAAKTSLVTSTDYTGVDLVAGGGTALAFNRKLGTLTDLTARVISVRSNRQPTKFRLDVMVTPMGHARICVPSGASVFGGYKPC